MLYSILVKVGTPLYPPSLAHIDRGGAREAPIYRARRGNGIGQIYMALGPRPPLYIWIWGPTILYLGTTLCNPSHIEIGLSTPFITF